MKMKKILSVLVMGVMVLSLAACGAKDDTQTSSSKETSSQKADDTKDTKDTKKADKLVIWTLSVDLEQFAKQYTEKTGVECETVIIEAADYQTKVQAAILAGEKEPDIIVGEPDMLPSMMEAGLFEDLDQYGAQDYSDKIVDYVWKKGQDIDGSQKAISYQITPAGIYYRRDIAKEVFGTEDPEEVGKLFANYDTILKTGDTLKAKGYKIFASDGEIGYFTGNDPWVADGKLNVSQTRKDYMDLCVKLYQGGYTAFATTWTAPWYQGMAGEIPVFESDTNLWDEEERKAAETNAKETTEVFAYGLPSWGVLTMRDNYKETEGKWGICKGPAYGMGGGTYVGISSNSERKETAWDFIKFCTLTEETLEWWISASKGDTVSYLPTLEKHAEDENEIYGGQKLYKFWLEQAEGIDLSKVTEYDRAIGDSWNSAIGNIKTGQMSKEEAINGFYDEIESTYPEIEVTR